jgi:predicted ATPase
VYEVEVGEGRVAPFFEVALGNDRYDSRTMGAGELAILFLWWSIDRASEDTLILIEEPETYLSPGSQQSFCAYLIASAVEKAFNSGGYKPLS